MQSSLNTFNTAENNQQTVKAAISRFIKEFLTTMSLNLQHKSDQTVLSYAEMVDILKHLNFLDADPIGPSSFQAQAVWNQLGGKGKGFILSRNLLVFLFAVQNIHVTKDQIFLNAKALPTMQSDDHETSYEKIAEALLRDEKDDPHLHTR